jgi:hypothetical protein
VEKGRTSTIEKSGLKYVGKTCSDKEEENCETWKLG